MQEDRKRQVVFRALADPTRREMVRRLGRGALTVNALAAGFAMSRPAVSRHLRKLRQAGLVRARRRGTERVCSLQTKPLGMVDGWLSDCRVYWQQRLGEWKRYVEGSDE
ncbi:MAG: ArsR/SmtB family transcription factor [Terriglobales bacterium]